MANKIKEKAPGKRHGSHFQNKRNNAMGVNKTEVSPSSIFIDSTQAQRLKPLQWRPFWDELDGQMLEYWRERSLIGQPALRRLMATRGSFTRALAMLVNEPIKVRVLAQGWQNTPDLGRVFAREVLLHSSGTPWIYALTLMRPSGLKGANRDLRQLQTRPLGELLFTAHSRRLNVHMTRVKPFSRLRRSAARQGVDLPAGSHARCSWFDYNGSALLVHECLLPSLHKR